MLEWFDIGVIHRTKVQECGNSCQLRITPFACPKGTGLKDFLPITVFLKHFITPSLVKIIVSRNSVILKGALNSNFLNLTINREKFCL